MTSLDVYYCTKIKQGTQYTRVETLFKSSRYNWLK